MRFMFLARLAAITPSLVIAAARADTLSVPGTGDGIEILQALSQAYSAPVEIPPSIGSGGGIAAVSDGRAVLGRVARPLSPSEEAAGLSIMPVMRIPAAVFVHASAGVTGLTFAQLASIYSGEITNWREVGGADLRIRVVRRETEDSTLKVLRATMPGWQALAITPKSKTAVTTQDAIDTVKETAGAIGFGPSSTATGKGLVILKLEGIDPKSPDYPSAVTVSLIHKKGALPIEAEGFLKFAVSEPAKEIIGNFGAVSWAK
jgi:phosphate transport system substrate-binding protein